MKQTLVKILTWLDNHLLLLVTGFLMAFIPLYPKIPLMNALPGYIVRVRLEDIFVLLAAIIWLIQAIRGKIKWRSLIFWLIATYAIAGILSVLSALFLVKSVPLQGIHIGKTLLHYFRYLEYFSLFIIAFSAIKSKQDVQTLITVFAFTIMAVAVYGYGQKYLYWPVYSTMNREFSKGMRLYLTEHARVQSTFAGHYDLAAFLVIALNLMLAFAYKQENKWKKLWFHLIHVIGLWLLLMTASRTSFISYMFGSIIILVLVARQKKTFKEQIQWGLSRFVYLIVIITFMVFRFGGDMYERFLHILEGYPQLNSTYHSANAYRKETWKQFLATVGLREVEPPQKPDNSMSLAEAQQAEREVTTDTDQRPVKNKPDDVYVDVPDKVRVATTSADGSTTYITEEKERTWSDNAMKYGLSVGIRLDTLWPNAVNGFLSNPVLGQGYATLNKEGPTHFTEAESTDNNYLRVLGETGLFGFVSFFGIIGVAIYFAFKFYQVDRTYTSAISIGFIGASMGLLLNATYIDVFAASKVAFTYWTITGIVVGLFYLGQNKKKVKKSRLFNLFQTIKTKIKSINS